MGRVGDAGNENQKIAPSVVGVNGCDNVDAFVSEGFRKIFRHAPDDEPTFAIFPADKHKFVTFGKKVT
jgi:hypothetical protein